MHSSIQALTEIFFYPLRLIRPNFMEIQKEAFEKKNFPPSRNDRNMTKFTGEKNHSFAWSFTNAILKFSLKTAGLCFLMSFNRSLQEYMQKNNENLLVMVTSFSRELCHSMTSQDHLK